jgi:hypothetical protein
MKLRVAAIVVSLVIACVAGYLMLRSTEAKVDVKPLSSQGHPKAEFDKLSYDFGAMDVGATGTHTFNVRNSGVAPLTLRLIDTSCKCTMVEIPPEGIPPGESRPIKLEWKTVEQVDSFRHGGQLETNDPDMPKVNIFVEGRVRARLAVRPDVLVLDDISPGQSQQARATVLSYMWDKFTVEIVESTLKGVKVEVGPVNEKLLAADERILAAQGLQVTFDASLPLGVQRGEIRYRVHVPNEPQVAETIHELPVMVDVVTPFTVHGRNVDGNSLVWGPVRQGTSRKESVLVVGRKLPSDFVVKNVTVDPPVLQVSQKRQDQGTNSTARFSVDVELPATAPVVNCMAPNVATVTLETNHPQFERVRFYVEFAVVK